MYWKRKNGGKGLIRVEECVRIEKTSLGFYLKEQEQQLLAEVVIEVVISDDENPKDVKTQLLQQHKVNYAQKRTHSAFMRGTEDVRDNNSWLWMKKGYLKKETELLIMAAQDQSLQTRWVKRCINRTTYSPKCRMCEKMDENVSYLVSECNELAQNEYKKLRHDKVTALLHWQ